MESLKIEFTYIRWPKLSLPETCTKDVRKAFLVDEDGKLLEKNDLKDILIVWLHDEYNVCPIDIEYKIIEET